MPSMEDLDLLQGRWSQVGYERDGIVQPIDGELDWQPQTEISGDSFTVTISDGSVILGGVFKLLIKLYVKKLWPARL